MGAAYFQCVTSFCKLSQAARRVGRLIRLNRMKKPDIAKSMARQSKTSISEAADRLDQMVYDLVHRLRQGKPAHLPGVGTFTGGMHGAIGFEREGGRRRG